MIHQFAHNVLNETDETIIVESSEDNAAAALLMARQTTRTIEILSRTLDPVIFGTPDFVEAVKQVVLKSRYTRVRILVHEPKLILKHGHRLLDLAFNLPSFFDLRVPGREHADYNESYAIFDTAGYIHRLNGERYEGKLNFNDKRTARLLLHQYDEIWEKSRPDPNLKRALL